MFPLSITNLGVSAMRQVPNIYANVTRSPYSSSNRFDKDRGEKNPLRGGWAKEKPSRGSNRDEKGILNSIIRVFYFKCIF